MKEYESNKLPVEFAYFLLLGTTKAANRKIIFNNHSLVNQTTNWTNKIHNFYHPSSILLILIPKRVYTFKKFNEFTKVEKCDF